MTIRNFATKIFYLFPFITKYAGIIGIGMALACFSFYGFLPDCIAMMGLSIVLTVASIVIIHIDKKNNAMMNDYD